MSIRGWIGGGVVGALLASGIGAAVAVPMIQAASGPAVIGACAAKSGGAMRLATRAGDCTKSERFVTWNAEGPAGPQGARGAKGDTGARGATGERGPSDVWVADNDYVLVPVGAEESDWSTYTPVVTITDLPAGKYVVRLSGTAYLPNPGTLMLQCAIGTTSTPMADARVSGGEGQVMSIDMVLTLESTTTLTARCMTGDSRGGIARPMLTATAVGAFHTSGS